MVNNFTPKKIKSNSFTKKQHQNAPGSVLRFLVNYSKAIEIKKSENTNNLLYFKN